MEVKVPFYTKTGDFLLTTNGEKYYVNESIGFVCKFYRNSSDRNRVDKTNYLSLVYTTKVIFKSATSITYPEIILEYNSFPNFNYVYIEELNRYYFINSITSVRNNLWKISLAIDVLMSYKNGIKSLRAFVDRNEFDYNNSIIDTKLVIESGYNIKETEIETDLFKTYYDSDLNITFDGTYTVTLNGATIHKTGG